MVKCPSEKAKEIVGFSAFTQGQFDPYSSGEFLSYFDCKLDDITCFETLLRN